MKNKLFFPIFMALTLLLSSCTKDMLRGNGDKKIEVRSMPEFTSVDLSGMREAEIILSNESKVELSGYANLVNNMETIVSSGHLYFRYPNHQNIKNDNVKLRIYTKNLEGIFQSGSTKVIISEGFHLDVFTVYQSGNSHLEIAGGSANRFVAEGSGNSKIFAKAFNAKKVELELSGNSYTEVAPSELLKVHASGRVRVKYWGTPASTEVQTSGEAKVERQ
jgi:Putative auto-transporter adhesin, head GIN domain